MKSQANGGIITDEMGLKLNSKNSAFVSPARKDTFGLMEMKKLQNAKPHN